MCARKNELNTLRCSSAFPSLGRFKMEINLAVIIRLCAIMIYKGSCGGGGKFTLATETRIKFWSQAIPCNSVELEEKVKQCRILDGHHHGIVSDDILINFWNTLKERNAMSCKAIFKEFRNEYLLTIGE